MKKILLSAMMLCAAGTASAEMVDVVVINTEAGQLATAWGDNTKANARRIKVKGPINGTDMKFLREQVQFASGNDNTSIYNPFDTRPVLDLSEAHFRAGGDTYKVQDNNYTVEFTEDDVVPAYCFTQSNASDRKAYFGKIILPNSVKRIEHHALWRCRCLGYAVIGENTTEVGERAFNENSNMRGLFITENNSLTLVGERAFETGAGNFNLVSIPEHVERVSFAGFASMSNVKKAYINGPTTLVDGILTNTAISQIHILSQTPAPFNNANIFKFDNSSRIYIPFGTTAAYKAAYTGAGTGRKLGVSDGLDVNNLFVETYLPLPSAASHGETWSTWSDEAGKYYEIPTGVDVYTVNGYADGVVNMASVSGSIPAEGCVINANAAGSVTYTEGTNDPTTLEVVGVLMMESDIWNSKPAALWQSLTTNAANATKAKAKSLESGIWLYTSTTATAPTINGTNYLVGTGTGTAEVGPVVENGGGEVTYRNFYLNWYNLNDTANEEAYALGFYRAAQSTLGAHKAYLRLPASVIGNVGGANLPDPAASQLRVVFNEELTTGIAAAKTETTLAPCYNLQGQRVNAAKAGLYIQNGKKVIR